MAPDERKDRAKGERLSYKQASLEDVQTATRPLGAAIMQPWPTITLPAAASCPIVTSRFQCRALADPRILPIRTSRAAPRWRLAYTLRVAVPELMPSRTMLSIDDPVEFLEAYRTQLDRTGPEAIRAILDRVREGHGSREVVSRLAEGGECVRGAVRCTLDKDRC